MNRLVYSITNTFQSNIRLRALLFTHNKHIIGPICTIYALLSQKINIRVLPAKEEKNPVEMSLVLASDG